MMLSFSGKSSEDYGAVKLTGMPPADAAADECT